MKRVIESFSEFIQLHALNEAEGKGGFLLILASTDPNNLGAGPATALGIARDTEFSGTLTLAEDMLAIGKNKNFGDKLTKGKAVNAGLDFLEIKVDGKTYTIKEKGLIQIPIKKDSKLEIKGAGNGLLALGRLCQYLSESAQKGFDLSSPFTGFMYIKLGDQKRRGESYYVNSDLDAVNNFRTSLGYEKSAAQFDVNVKEEAGIEDAEVLNEETKLPNRLNCFCDTVADAIKAAAFVANGQKWNSVWSAYKGFNDIIDYYEEGSFPKGKELENAEDLLSISLHYLLNDLSAGYPLDKSKIFEVDLRPIAKKIITGQPKNLKQHAGEPIKAGLNQLIDTFALKSIPGYPEFNSQVPDFYSHLKSYITDRVLKTIGGSYQTAMEKFQPGPAVGAEGGSSGGKRTYTSGKLD